MVLAFLKIMSLIHALTLHMPKKDAAIDTRREIFKEKQMQIWYELVSALDKQSVLYLRPYKGDGLLKHGMCQLRDSVALRDLDYKS